MMDPPFSDNEWWKHKWNIQYGKEPYLNSTDILETTPSGLLFHWKQEFTKDQIWSAWIVGATVMFLVSGTFVITKYWMLMHCHAESTNISLTIIPDVFFGLAPLWINCLALGNKFMTYNTVTVKKTSPTLSRCFWPASLSWDVEGEWLFQLTGLLLICWTTRENLGFVTCYKPWVEGLVIHNSSRHKNTNHCSCSSVGNLGTNLVEIHQICKSSLQINLHFPY